MMIIHILPVDDSEIHSIFGTICRCNPIPKNENGNVILIHQSFDLREVVEEAYSVLGYRPENINSGWTWIQTIG